MSALAAHFPDPIVGLVPDLLEMTDERTFERPARLLRDQARAPGDKERIQNFAVDVELNLARGEIADAHGGGPLIAGQPRQRIFRQPALDRKSTRLNSSHMSIS